MLYQSQFQTEYKLSLMVETYLYLSKDFDQTNLLYTLCNKNIIEIGILQLTYELCAQLAIKLKFVKM
jgi:hypothetical protein